MKNFKIGFSMLVAILVLSIVTSAFAAAPADTTGVGIKAVSPTTVRVSPNAQVGGLKYTGATQSPETGWRISLYEADGTTLHEAQDVSTNSATFTVVEGADYVVKVQAYADAANANWVTFEPFTFHYDSSFVANNDFDYVIGDAAKADNKIPNANKTGEGQLAKGISGHKTHGDYKNNTNSCASCHQTHTAAGKNLLFKETAEEACLACHDGTGMTIYNVFPTSMANDNGSGTFAGTSAGNMSVHLTDESVHLAAAPGSNLKISGANWSGEFSCDTCHNPHGSYSTRLLQTNTAGFMNVERTYVGGTPGADTTTFVAPKQWYGGLFKNVQVLDVTGDAGGENTGNFFSTTGVADNSVFAKVVTINGKATNVNAAPGVVGSVTGTAPNQKYAITNYGKLDNPAIALQPGKEVYLLKYKVTNADVAAGGYYEKTGLAPDAVIYQFVRKMDGADLYQRIPFNTLANNKPDFAGVSTFSSLNNVKGYFVTTDSPSAVTNFRAFNIVKLPQVATAATVVNGVQETKTPWNVTNLVTSSSTVAYAQYCGTCHVDYASGSGYATDLDNGTKAYHHTANSTSAGRSCAYCHYAHGTDVTFMRDAVGNTVESLQTTGDISVVGTPTMTEADAINYLKDKNPSSALKRYTNMSVCYGCHVSSHYAGLGNNGSTGVGSSLGLDNNGLPKTGTWQ